MKNDPIATCTKRKNAGVSHQGKLMSANELYNNLRLNICVDGVIYICWQDEKNTKNNKERILVKKKYFCVMVRGISGNPYSKDVDPLFIRNTKNERGRYIDFFGENDY